MPSQYLTPDMWVDRTEGLIAVAEELGARGGDARRRTALTGLRLLSAFARKQFQFIGRGFAEKGPLAPDPHFPPVFLLEATIHQVTYDIDVFMSVLGQREKAVGTPAMQKTLEMADRLAADALAPAVRHRLIEQTAVVTYFQKADTIRLIPYAPLALIGLDLTALVELQRLVAVAHEAGHHVYRQLTVNFAAELEMIPAEAEIAPVKWPDWLNAWEEEVFADAYSVLIAGPAAVLAMQSMIMANLPARLPVDDGDHPAPILRPTLMNAVLHELARRRADPVRAQLERTADVLDKRWNGYLATIGAPSVFHPKHAHGEVQLAEARALVAERVSALLSESLAPLASDTHLPSWSRGLDEGHSSAVNSLWGQFEKTALSLSAPIPELVLPANSSRAVVEPSIPGARPGARTLGQIGDPTLDGWRDAVLAGKAIKPREWKAVFVAGDWTTEGSGSGILPPRFRH